MLSFRLVLPNQDVIIDYARPSYTKAFKDAKKWLQWDSTPDNPKYWREEVGLFYLNKGGNFYPIKVLKGCNL